MTVALRHGMRTLLREYRHELLERAKWLAHFEVDLDLVALQKVCGKWRIVIGVEPVPAEAAMIVVAKHPLETFDIRLTDACLKFLLVLLRMYMEFVRVVPELIAVLAKLDFVNIRGHFRVILCIAHLLHLRFYSLFHFLVMLLSRSTS